MDWYKEGFWDLQPFEATARQFLEPKSQPYPAFAPLAKSVEQSEQVSHIKDYSFGRTLKGVTLDQFKKMQFDIILASVPQHAAKFIKLRDLYQPQAKMVFQIGNAWTFDHSFPIRNLLSSARIPDLMGFHQIQYHQEFSLETFHYSPPNDTHKVFAFINGLGSSPLYSLDFALFLQLEKLLPNWEFKSFGGLCRDGGISDPEEVAAKMREATFIFQTKRAGDGFGHSLHQSAAVGRPIITRMADYHDKLAEPLIEDAVSALTVDNRTPEQIAEIIQADAQTIETLGYNIHQKFKANVDFDAEELKIRDFLTNLL